MHTEIEAHRITGMNTQRNKDPNNQEPNSKQKPDNEQTSKGLNKHTDKHRNEQMINKANERARTHK